MQEINFHLKSKDLIYGYIVVNQYGMCCSEYIIHDTTNQKVAVGGAHTAAWMAYSDLVNAVEIEVKRLGDSIDFIDNPCNTPLINKQDQCKVILAKKMIVNVKVNGV